ncbi:MAG TPA: hypothetical protein VN372_00730 [Methanospirillum sp.]|nr:hypothetical protein [Methanospirillum sp.]
MNREVAFLTFGLVLISVFACVASGEDTPVSQITISGNTSVISLEDVGTYQLLLSSVEPNASVSDTTQNSSIILEKIISKEPSTAAIALLGPDGNETVFMAQVSESGYSVENRTLAYNLTPLPFYDGTLLTRYSEKKTEIQPGKYGITHLYLESAIKKQDNSGCLICLYGCAASTLNCCTKCNSETQGPV